MRGNTFYGKRQMFTPDFMDWFENLRLPPYQLEKRAGQYELTFEGSWPEVMLWEIPALAILMELRSRAVLRDMGRFELQVLYARAMTKVWEKVELLRGVQGLRIADFGTRRRHSFLWQDWCVQALEEGLGASFTGTSNCLIAKNRDMEAIGTNAHELPMVYAALAEGDEALRQSPMACWPTGKPNTTATCASSCPTPLARPASLPVPPIGWLDGPASASTAATQHRARKRLSPGGNPTAKTLSKLIIFSDGLNVGKILELHAQFQGRVRVSFGWGTMLTNDFIGLVPDDALAPFSLVCKAVEADGRPTVKLSDNPNKAMGPAKEIARYKRVFGVGTQARVEVVV